MSIAFQKRSLFSVGAHVLLRFSGQSAVPCEVTSVTAGTLGRETTYLLQCKVEPLKRQAVERDLSLDPGKLGA